VTTHPDQARVRPASESPDVTPVLWHLKVSHYNEKVRWALDYKGVPHSRRAAVPGRHRAIAERLTGGSTFPILILDGEAIGDSTHIIEALERRFPEPALYPTDPVDRPDAVYLEDFFDNELGPHMRVLVVHHMLPDVKLALGAFAPDLAGIRLLVARARARSVRRQFVSQLDINPRSVELAFEKVRGAGQRFQEEVGGSGYLVGDSFTVADLTLASLLSPAVAPKQFPYPQPQREHPLLDPLRDLLAEYGLVEWTLRMYGRHRGVSSEVKGGDRSNGRAGVR
jgi:glutathione S-transferase